MPVSVLIALILAFGYDSGAGAGPLRRSEIAAGCFWVVGGIASIALLSFILGRWTAWHIGRLGYVSSSLRRRYFWGSRLLGVLTLSLFGAMIHVGGWPRVVRAGFGLERVLLFPDVVIILPFLLAQLANWWGLYPAERLLRPAAGSNRAAGLPRYLTLKTRQTLGLLLPVLLVFSLGQDLLRKLLPGMALGAPTEPIGMALMGLLVLLGSPLFVRLAWPSRPLPPGPLRDRLERLASRFGFRCTDILIQDTGLTVVNAGVAGTLPWFRYVFLTDALVEDLSPNEIAAVFGHEIGHIAHRHLPYFGFFLFSSMALLGLVLGRVKQLVGTSLPLFAVASNSSLAPMVEDWVGLILFGLYFFLVFGHVSRRFERQADVFGCRAVSCGVVDCPPHADLNGRDTNDSRTRIPLCPVGIRTFATALGNVASLNGMAHGMRSWRHGSIRRRIAFVEALEGRPDAERQFQEGISRLRLGIAAVLIVAVFLATADAMKWLR